MNYGVLGCSRLSIVALCSTYAHNGVCCEAFVGIGVDLRFLLKLGNPHNQKLIVLTKIFYLGGSKEFCLVKNLMWKEVYKCHKLLEMYLCVHVLYVESCKSIVILTSTSKYRLYISALHGTLAQGVFITFSVHGCTCTCTCSHPIFLLSISSNLHSSSLSTIIIYVWLGLCWFSLCLVSSDTLRFKVGISVGGILILILLGTTVVVILFIIWSKRPDSSSVQSKKRNSFVENDLDKHVELSVISKAVDSEKVV